MASFNIIAPWATCWIRCGCRLKSFRSLRSTTVKQSSPANTSKIRCARGGGIVNVAWFKRCRDSELPKTFDSIIMSIDSANKASEISDYSVCITIGVKDKNYYALHVWRKQVDYPTLKRAVQEQHDLYRPSVVLIEDRASGTQLIQELQASGLSVVQPYRPSADKIMRLRAQTGIIEAGFVYLLEQAHWLAEFLHELEAFPNSRYSDQVDAFAQALDWVRNRRPGWAFEVYMEMTYKKMASAAATKSSDKVELITPQHPGTIYTSEGESITPRSFARIWVPKQDVPGLVQKGFKRVLPPSGTERSASNPDRLPSDFRPFGLDRFRWPGG